jgi:hypothetical protein
MPSSKEVVSTRIVIFVFCVGYPQNFIMELTACICYLMINFAAS